MSDNKNILDIDENLRLLGTAHVSKTSVDLVREQINEYKPDIVAVELCESRLAALKKPEGIDNEDLLKIISEGTKYKLSNMLHSFNFKIFV